MVKFNETTKIVCHIEGQINLLNFKGQSAPQNNSTQENTNKIFGFVSLSKFLYCPKPTTAKRMKSGRVSFMKTGCQFIFDQEIVLFELGNTPKTV